ncbi:SIS domain-containing protein [Microbacterium oxydans]|jgi:fructoselysine-6-P-deglycase FrlB-like protein|uniref:SIS domain-containing protein n=1 Tax=Microbacterium oxydans TaxID=82380 RepID=UPI00226B09A5|nr:SIS domain-containing protein [Microbacterium oxydans]WAA65909.1 SIS domain-containing protein [Microbacterium oxydans]
MDGYISYAEATAAQADGLATAIPHIERQVVELAARGALGEVGPLFLGIGASLAAAAPAVWHLRERGITAWRLDAGDTPLPLATGEHPVIAVSQSGRSSETIAALNTIPEALRYGVVNTVPSPLSDLATRLVGLGSIPDSYASTIGYTATVVALSMLAEAWAGGEVDPAWHDFAALFRETETMLAPQIDRAADLITSVPSLDFVGGGSSTGSAEAGALLFREVARIPASAMGTRQYLHGSMESAGEGAHVLFGSEREHEVARMLSAAGHRVVLVTTDDVESAELLEVVRLPQSSPNARAVLEALFLQGLVARVAQARGVEIEEFVFHNDDTKVDAGAAQ